MESKSSSNGYLPSFGIRNARADACHRLSTAERGRTLQLHLQGPDRLQQDLRPAICTGLHTLRPLTFAATSGPLRKNTCHEQKGALGRAESGLLETHTQHEDLLNNFDADLEKLRQVELHPVNKPLRPNPRDVLYHSCPTPRSDVHITRAA
eukprot:5009561-Pyramimonas_sp.AAC.1